MKYDINENEELKHFYSIDQLEELLEKYSIWLENNGYIDSDWRDEKPFAPNVFLKIKKSKL